MRFIAFVNCVPKPKVNYTKLEFFIRDAWP